MNKTGPLARLEKVDLRTAWMSEAGDFTPWLALEENIALLADTIGIDLEVEAQEKDVGPFRADILCKDTANDTWVLIENQLERTDHTHLGQLLTYAAGLHAVTIVWIAERFTEEHRAAMDWLNEVTGEGINFFGLEVELWRIADSPIAPKFNIISSPNDWTKTIIPVSTTSTPARKLQTEFWIAFREFVQAREASFRPTKPLPQHWMNIAIGRSGFKLNAIASLFDTETGSFDRNEIRAELHIHDNHAKNHFSQLYADRPAVEQEFGEQLTWHNPDGRKSCRIYTMQSGIDLRDRSRWREYHEWLTERLERLKLVFAERVKQIDSEDSQDNEAILA